MAATQQKLREILFQLLYSQDFIDNKEEDIVPFLMAEHAVSKKTVYQVHDKLAAFLAKREEIDGFIREASHAYDFERIPKAEKNILRLGVYELCFDEAIPPKVAIAEAIRLARKFTTSEGATFVNAILDAIYKSKAN
jgi:N utilization substance protein B